MLEDACALTGVPEEMLKAALDEEETARAERDEDSFLCLLDTPTITDTDEERLRRIVGGITDQGRFFNVSAGVITEIDSQSCSG